MPRCAETLRNAVGVRERLGPNGGMEVQAQNLSGLRRKWEMRNTGPQFQGVFFYKRAEKWSGS